MHKSRAGAPGAAPSLCVPSLQQKEQRAWGVGGWVCVCVGGGGKLQIYKSWSSHKQL